MELKGEMQEKQTGPTKGHAENGTYNEGKSIEALEYLKSAADALFSPQQPSKADCVRLVKVSHMRYRHADMDKLKVFMADFGMAIAQETDKAVWFRGYGKDPYVYYAERGPENVFLGGCFEVESYADLEKAAKLSNKRYPAPKISELKDSPGGGNMVTIYDPEGFPMNFIHGQQTREADPERPQLLVNFEKTKVRQGKFQRFKPGPAPVHKLGHFGLTIADFDVLYPFYTEHFNFVASDLLYVEQEDGKKKDVAAFLHIDRGEDYVDHHTFFMATAAEQHVHHCSFEVHDFDTQNLGHQWLAEKGYTNVWGVGRHILGSQIFDYWRDTSNFMIEHYADGDLVNNKVPTGRMAAGDEALAVWGPDVPSTFLD